MFVVIGEFGFTEGFLRISSANEDSFVMRIDFVAVPPHRVDSGLISELENTTQPSRHPQRQNCTNPLGLWFSAFPVPQPFHTVHVEVSPGHEIILVATS